jgi:hypothetical protein
MFGMSAGTLIGAVAPAVVGGLLGGKESSTSAQQKQELDPRMQSLLYGNYTGGGLLGDVNKLSKQQLGQGGLNPMQNAGLEMQRQTLMDPRYSQGYEQMRNSGASLLGSPVAGNPFAQGYTGGPNFNVPQRPQQQSQQQYQMNPSLLAAQTPIGQSQAASPVTPPTTPQPAMDQATLDQYMDEWRARREYASLLQAST